MLIEYNHVNIYQQDTVILKDVNFGIDKGEFAYIIGKVGSGKSSLLKSLYCELDLYSEHYAVRMFRNYDAIWALSSRISNCFMTALYIRTFYSF